MTKISRALGARRGMNRGSSAGEAGFTVIELVIVLVVIGVIVGVGIPTYFTLRHERSDPAAQNSLQSALGLAQSFYLANNHSFNGLCPTSQCGAAQRRNQAPDGYMGELAASTTGGPPGVRNPLHSNGTNLVSIAVVNSGTDVIIAALADGTGNCWAIIETTQPGHTILGIASNRRYIAHAVVPASLMRRTKCSAGIFDTANLIGTRPTVGDRPLSPPSNWPST
jgi:prepilin-type N-terminal cleavage/methylation domain-containing protein